MSHHSSFIIHHSKFLLVGLGNPGKEYEKTRHNAGRMALEHFRVAHNFPEWERDAKRNALVSKGEAGGISVELLLPETFMNNSGSSLHAPRSTLNARSLIVVHDDIDLPLGSFKIVYNRSSAGHKGVESIINALGTKEFTRIRIGTAPIDASGKIKKPKGEEAVSAFVLQRFSAEEKKIIQKVCDEACEAIDDILKKPPADDAPRA